jgi:hypothetical protein
VGIASLIEKLFELVAPPKAMKLDGTTEAMLAHSLSAWHRVSGDGSRLSRRASCSRPRAHNALSEKRTRTAEENIESFAAQHWSVINFMPVRGRVYFVRDQTVVTSIA